MNESNPIIIPQRDSIIEPQIPAPIPAPTQTVAPIPAPTQTVAPIPAPTQTVVNITNPYNTMGGGFFPQPINPIVENIVIKQEEKKSDNQFIKIIGGLILVIIGTIFLLKYNQVFLISFYEGIDIYSILAGVVVFMGMGKMLFSGKNIIYTTISVLIAIGSLLSLVGIGIYQSINNSGYNTIVGSGNYIAPLLTKKEVKTNIYTTFGSIENTGSTDKSLIFENTSTLPMQIITGIDSVIIKQPYHRSVIDPIYTTNILKLNKNIFYRNLNFQGVLMNYNLDFNNIKYENLNFKAPYLDLDLKINNQIANNTINIKGGIIKTKITIPPMLGVRIKTKYVIGNIDIKDFSDMGSGVYESLNYEKSENKTTIFLESIYADIIIK